MRQSPEAGRSVPGSAGCVSWGRGAPGLSLGQGWPCPPLPSPARFLPAFGLWVFLCVPMSAPCGLVCLLLWLGGMWGLCPQPPPQGFSPLLLGPLGFSWAPRKGDHP